MTRTLLCGVSLSLLLAAPAEAEEPGKATLPMQLWEEMLKELEASDRPDRAPMAVVPMERRIDGRLRKGLFSGKMTTRFAVIEARGHVRVPILDAAASLGDVRLNGKRTSLLKEGAFYTVGVEKTGIYTLELELFWGKEQDRFTRRLSFRLPQAGVTRLSVLVPEGEIEARLDHGVLTAERKRPDGTLLEGNLDPTGSLDLSWTRRLTHKSGAAVRTAARLQTLFTVQEALVEGLAVFDLEVLEGETERVDLRLPADIEVLGVDGDAVLQWKTEEEDGGKLTVLFRYLVEKATRISVRFQFPVDESRKVTLRTPLPPPGTAMTGALGVQAPAGLDVQAIKSTDAVELTLRDMPPELTDLTSKPLLFGYSFEKPPAIEVSVARHEAVELTSTLIDDVQASTVVISDGTEITKIKLRLRNNTRQYLSVELPEGAELTHSLIDGQPVRPAAPGGGALLFPLRQSERIESGRSLTHSVQSGETLSAISNFYFSEPNQWQAIVQNNPGQLSSEWDLAVGQVLRIPARQGATVQESSFVIEMAYKRTRPALGAFGRYSTALPKLDVDAVLVTWHLYLPKALTPLSFEANLTQYSAIRYDPFRRVRDFLRRASWISNAWAGGRYKNILSERKVIYRAEAERRSTGKMVLASFPLVGERYRFKRILLGKDTPQIAAVYATRLVAPVVRWAAFLIAFVLAWLVLRPSGDRRTWLVAAAALVVMLVVAHFVLGVHRRIIWGVDLALLVMWARLRGGGWWRALIAWVQSPWTALAWLRVGNVLLLFGLFILLLIILKYPLLLSSIFLVLMSIWWRRNAAKEQEVGHA